MEKSNENDKIARLKERAENTPEVKKIKKAEKIVERGLLISGAVFILFVIAAIIISNTKESGYSIGKAVSAWLTALIYIVFAIGACFVIARIILKYRYHQELTAQIDLIQTVDDIPDDTVPFGELENIKSKKRATIREEAFDVDKTDVEKPCDESDGGTAAIREELNRRDRVSSVKKYIAFDMVASVLTIVYCIIVVLLPFVTILGEKKGMFGGFGAIGAINGEENIISLNIIMFADALNINLANTSAELWGMSVKQWLIYFYGVLFLIAWIVVIFENVLFIIKLILSLFSCETCIRNQKFKITMFESFLSKRKSHNLKAYNIGFFVVSFVLYVLPSYYFVKKAINNVDWG